MPEPSNRTTRSAGLYESGGGSCNGGSHVFHGHTGQSPDDLALTRVESSPPIEHQARIDVGNGSRRWCFADAMIEALPHALVVDCHPVGDDDARKAAAVQGN